MNKAHCFTAALVAAMPLAGASAQTACTYPESVGVIPDGNTATSEQMLGAQRLVKAYVQTMEEYLACLDTEVAALGDEATEAHLLIRDKRHNAAVEAMEAVAGDFNYAVRVYKARTE